MRDNILPTLAGRPLGAGRKRGVPRGRHARGARAGNHMGERGGETGRGVCATAASTEPSVMRVTNGPDAGTSRPAEGRF